jgi:hypothetical protein
VAYNLAPKKKIPCMQERSAALNRDAKSDDRLACAVLELRQSIWDKIWHIARCWKVDPKELVEASRWRS